MKGYWKEAGAQDKQDGNSRDVNHVHTRTSSVGSCGPKLSSKGGWATCHGVSGSTGKRAKIKKVVYKEQVLHWDLKQMK